MMIAIIILVMLLVIFGYKSINFFTELIKIYYYKANSIKKYLYGIYF